jgi:hypothetical protein
MRRNCLKPSRLCKITPVSWGMEIPRRSILGYLYTCILLPKLFAKPFEFEVDRLLAEVPEPLANAYERRYRATATINPFSIPLVSKAGVGSGYISIEQFAGKKAADSSTIAIQFAAGSWPDAARGLNRLGYIQEAIVENASSQVTECAYFAFMTTSQEKNLDQAKKAMESSNAAIPYVAAEGSGRSGRFSSRLNRISFPAAFTWRDCGLLVDRVRAAIAGAVPAERISKTLAADEAAPATFLYTVRKAILNPNPASAGSLIYNGKEFELRTTKEPEPTLAHFAGKNVVRLSATLREYSTGRQTPFKVWYEAGFEHMPPLRFEYQARSFLRLSFDYDPAMRGPEFNTGLAHSQTDAKEKA